MDRNKQREIASKGGKAAHQKGTAHEWTSEESREAGRKGGMASHRRKQEQQQKETRRLREAALFLFHIRALAVGRCFSALHRAAFAAAIRPVKDRLGITAPPP